MASVLSVPNSQVARMTSQIGQFLWGRYPTRVAIEQLALPVSKGGLNLHLPLHKSKALLSNRYFHDLEFMPFARTLSVHLSNPPNVMAIPALYPCMKAVAKIIPYIPEQLTRNPSASVLHDHFRECLSIPKVVQDNPTISWPKVWRNIKSGKLLQKVL